VEIDIPEDYEPNPLLMENGMIIPIILSGGTGSRLWPLSRELYPKQLLPLVNSHTMLQNTVLRTVGIPDITDPILVCNADHRFMVAEQMRQLNLKPSSIILEPIGRIWFSRRLIGNEFQVEGQPLSEDSSSQIFHNQKVAQFVI
jgi:hypothetical protein